MAVVLRNYLDVPPFTYTLYSMSVSSRVRFMCTFKVLLGKSPANKFPVRFETSLHVHIDFVVIDTCAPVSVHEVSRWPCILSLITFLVRWNGLRADAAFALDVLKKVTPPTNGRQKLGWVSRTWFTLCMLLKWNSTYRCKIPLALVASCVFSRAVPLSRKMLVVTISKVFVCCSEKSPLRICAFPSCRSRGHQR